ncbi:glycosyltransferase [Corynebacterium incognita]|uniref:4,4'-diaponeurosporenoate glycosyltransferase n=1 Tax=Corynebacterium incognita TaxID=2754725 RepID=A0A7G7CQR2_9CORY|nr:glycosyltransferase [Corynebacterium incognita]QNE89928.1 glycosyltransferase [Corynebacterium incognita]
MKSITHALVVIPAHDEEDHIASCLAAVFAAARHVNIHVEVVVALDQCNDRTEQIVDDVPHDIHALSFSFAEVGRSRHAGIIAGLVILRDVDKSNIWILNTDADSVVPPTWIATHLRYAQDYDAVAGTVDPDWGDTPQEIIDEYNRHYDNSPGHSHIHGANMSFGAGAYLDVGGFPRTDESEDVALLDLMLVDGMRIARIAEDPVVTSTRDSDRTPGGFSGYIAALGDEIDQASRDKDRKNPDPRGVVDA